MHGHFGDFFAHPAKLGRNFRAPLEAMGVETNLREHRTAENLIAGCLVVNACAVEKIGKMRQQLRAQEKAQAALGPIGAHAVNYVGFPLLQRTQKRGIVLRIVFEIGILNQNILAACIFESSADGCALAAILLMEDYGDIVGEGHGLQLLARSVG